MTPPIDLKAIIAAKKAEAAKIQLQETLKKDNPNHPIFNKTELVEDPKKLNGSAPKLDPAALLAKLKATQEKNKNPTGLTEEKLHEVHVGLHVDTSSANEPLKEKLEAQKALQNHFAKSREEQQKDLIAKEAARLNSIQLNVQQQKAVTLVTQHPEIKELCLIGAAGTGKTTTVKRIVQELREGYLKDVKSYMPHKHFPMRGPAIAFVSFTNRAVRNLRRVLPPDLSQNCLTIHALLEYYFEFEEVIDNTTGLTRTTMRSVPARNKENPLTDIKFIFIDEAAMVAVDLYEQLREALPKDCRIMYLGDLNQLPPIFDTAILGYKLAESADHPDKLPCIELTEVYRQALDNPILFDAHRILNCDTKYFDERKIKEGKLDRPPHIIYKPFKKRIEKEMACHIIGQTFQKMMDAKEYNPDEDIILIPFNKSFGTLEFNKYIAQRRQEISGEPVYEVISLFVKHYFAVGDRIIFGKFEGTITAIRRNTEYVGKRPKDESALLSRWGHYRKSASDTDTDNKTEVDPDEGDFANMSMEDIDALLARTSGDREGKRQASHTLEILLSETGETIHLNEAGQINSILFAYAITVHKAQGAEWRKIFFILHDSHATMASRELIYTALTRAREQAVMIVDPRTFERAVGAQRIEGLTLKEKAEFFKGKKAEKQSKLELQ